MSHFARYPAVDEGDPMIEVYPQHLYPGEEVFEVPDQMWERYTAAIEVVDQIERELSACPKVVPKPRAEGT